MRTWFRSKWLPRAARARERDTQREREKRGGERQKDRERGRGRQRERKTYRHAILGVATRLVVRGLVIRHALAEADVVQVDVACSDLQVG